MRPSKFARLFLPLLLLSLAAPASMSAQARGRVLYPLPAYPACGQPLTPLIADADGNLYGTGLNSGDAHAGCIFELSPSGAGWRETVLHSSSGPDGSGPDGALVFDSAGNLYGTAGQGGAYDEGVVFELSPEGNGAWTESILYSFGGWDGDGWGPGVKLIFDSQGNIYGTAGGGPRGAGTIFKLNPSDDGWIETILYSFSSGINGPGGDGREAASQWIARAACMASRLMAVSMEAALCLS
jgi:uncharacterized repeat protein (TIGR03803 family)